MTQAPAHPARPLAVAIAMALAVALGFTLLVPPAGSTAEEPGSLTGRVTDTAGRGVRANVAVVDPAFATGADLTDYVRARAATAADGTWTVPVGDGGLPAGRYLLLFQPDDKTRYQAVWYSNSLTRLGAREIEAVAGAGVAGLDAVVPNPTVLSGRLGDVRGKGVPGALIALYPQSFGNDDDIGDVTPLARTTTDARGRWNLSVTALPGGNYRMRASADGHPARWYRAARSPESSALVVVTPGRDRRGLDMNLPDFGRIAGKVEANGERVPDAVVALSELVGDGDPTTDYFETTTDEDGRYLIKGLPPGTYRVRTSADQYRLPDRFFGGSNRRSAAPVLIASGRTKTGIDPDLSFQPDFPGRKSAKHRPPKKPAGLDSRPVDGFVDYQGQQKCLSKTWRGTRAMYRLLKKSYGRGIVIGLNRACDGEQSEHYDGRALDWMVNSRVRSQARRGDAFVRWISKSRGKEVGAMARRLGVMYVIWRDRIWKQYQAELGWQKYYDCWRPSMQGRQYDNGCHRNHVHISMNWKGAKKKTSWWRAQRKASRRG